MNAVLHRASLPEHNVNQYKYFVGNGIRSLVQKALPDNLRDDETIDRFFNEMIGEYGRRCNEETRPYVGIMPLLKTLHGMNIKMAVLSNKIDKLTKFTVSEYFPEIKFDAVLDQRPGVSKKPDPSTAFEISELLNVPTSRFLYLGDTGTDMKTANSAGMFAVGALWGFRAADELLENGARALIEKPEKLLGFLTPLINPLP